MEVLLEVQGTREQVTAYKKQTPDLSHGKSDRKQIL